MFARKIPVYRAVGDGFPVPGRRNASPTVFIVKCCEFAENRCRIATFYCRAVNNRPYIGYGTSNRQTGICSAGTIPGKNNRVTIQVHCARIAVKRAALQTGIWQDVGADLECAPGGSDQQIDPTELEKL